MSGNITINPLLTTNAAGSFDVTTDGYIQGTALNDPAVRFQLAGGYLASTETMPMWGGVGITELVPTKVAGSAGGLGGAVARATSLTGSTAITGFTVFDQDHSMVTSPQSPVPLAAGLMGVNFYRFGTNARIVVAIDPALVDLEGNIITSSVSWDFGLQRLIPYVASYPANVFTAMTWSAGVVTGTTTTAHGISVGDDFTVSGVVPAGYNGTYTAVTGTTGSTLKYALATNPGSVTTEGTLVAGGGALNCRLVDVNIGNSMTVNYDPVSGFATWNRNGSTGIIVI